MGPLRPVPAGVRSWSATTLAAPPPGVHAAGPRGQRGSASGRCLLCSWARGPGERATPAAGCEEERQMTKDKARKHEVRARMTKTGERYTAARRHVVRPEAPPWVTDDLGASDETIRRGSGKGWEEWIRLLDDVGSCRPNPHGDRAPPGAGSRRRRMVGAERHRRVRASPREAGAPPAPDGFCAYASKTVRVARQPAPRRRSWTRVRAPGGSSPGRSACAPTVREHRSFRLRDRRLSRVRMVHGQGRREVERPDPA